jgi:hypothetical protein
MSQSNRSRSDYSRSMLTSLCIFCATAGSAFYIFVGEPHGPGEIASSLASLLLSWSIALWIEADALRNEGTVTYDFDSLIFFCWPVVAPIYLFRTRGCEAIIPIGLCFMLQLGGLLFGAVMAYPHSITYFHALRR